MGPVNKVIASVMSLMDAALEWAAEIGEKSPTAIRFLKQSFNADTDHLGRAGGDGDVGLDLAMSPPPQRIAKKGAAGGIYRQRTGPRFQML